jgi:hypothetical protein
MATFDQDALDLQRQQAEAAAAAAKDEDASGEEGGAPAVPGADPSAHLARFLLKDCCNGRPDVCAPLIADLLPCCPPKENADV